MKIKENDIIELDDNSYIVIDLINSIDNTYAFLINNDKYKNDMSIVKVIKNNKNIELKNIEDEKELKYVIYRLYIKHKKDILSYFI